MSKLVVRRGERGSALVEFLLCSVFWLPLLLGVFVLGLNLIRAIQVTQVCRDSGHMYSYGVDFSQTQNKNLVVRLANGLNMTATGGNGILILSTLTYIADSDCSAAGLQPNSASCPNYHQIVFTKRLTIGNTGLRVSSFGTPKTSLMDSTGSIASKSYLTDTSVRATGFSSVINLNTSGQYAYLSEMYVSSPDYSPTNFLGTTGISARSIF